jgi:hypothetical protein
VIARPFAGVIVAMALGLASAARAEDFVCPEAPKQVESEVRTEVSLRTRNFGAAEEAELKTRVDKTIVDLFAKYPNADRVAILHTFMAITCNIIKNATRLSDEQKFDYWWKVMTPAIQPFLPDDRKSDFGNPSFDLDLLQLGVSKDYTDSKIGKPKQWRRPWIGGGRAPPEKFKEYLYRHSGLDIRIVYGADDQALAIFVGLGGDENIVTFAGLGDWPIKVQALPARWADLKFRDMGDEPCSRRLDFAASNMVIAKTCEFTYYPAGGPAHEKRQCFFSAGYSDGTFGVYVTDRGPDTLDIDLDKLRTGSRKSDLARADWDRIEGTGINYFMLTCDKELIKIDWKSREFGTSPVAPDGRGDADRGASATPSAKKRRPVR